MMEPEIKLTEIQVEGMTCTNCAMSVRKRLEKQGMQQVDVNFASGEVRFENIPQKSLAELTESIEELGYVVVKENPSGSEKKNS